MPDKLRAQFQKAFVPEWRDAIVGSLRNAYSKACEDYKPEEGSNPSTFGFCVYHYAAKRLVDAASLHGVVVKSRTPVFRLDVAGFEVGCHRVGSNERESIDEALPDNCSAAWTLSNHQLTLPGFERPPRAGGVVIAHLGNPTDGLCAVYLALPDSIDDNNRIKRWGHAERIWQRGDGVREREPIKATLPPEETIEVPVIQRRRRPGSGA